MRSHWLTGGSGQRGTACSPGLNIFSVATSNHLDQMGYGMRITFWMALGAICLVPGRGEVRLEPITAHYYIQLIWGTNHQKPATADFKPVGPKLKTELGRIFQWQQYWETKYQ